MGDEQSYAVSSGRHGSQDFSTASGPFPLIIFRVLSQESGKHLLSAPGCGAFDDLNTIGTQLGKITSITVRHGVYVDSIAVAYKGTHGSSHGGGGGSEDTFDLEDDEWLTEIRGRSGALLDQGQFFLSSGRVSPVYGGYGGAPFAESRANMIVKAFFGRSGLYIDQLVHNICDSYSR
jgi:hypothetical protein